MTTKMMLNDHTKPTTLKDSEGAKEKIKKSLFTSKQLLANVDKMTPANNQLFVSDVH